MDGELLSLKNEILKSVEEAKDLKSLDDVRVKAIGKQGSVSLLMKTLGKMDPEERKEKGVLFNTLRQEVTQEIENKKETLNRIALDAKLKAEKIDVTLPERHSVSGHIHPLSQVMFEVIEIFSDMGFWVADGPDIENDFHNFTALNIDEVHPARQEQDTFYLPKNEQDETVLLRTHTSPVQIRTMLDKKPPIRIVAPGRTFRCDYDQTHTPNFHQIEGLFIDKDINMGHLKGCLLEFCRRFFKVPNLELRLRPSYFPFTEPSAEVDISCVRKGKELIIGEKGDWLEILGSGMVHPKVLENCGIDSSVYQGFAFGMGIERVAMLKYGIPDLRSFYDPDVRWIKHYGFSAFAGLMGGAVK